MNAAGQIAYSSTDADGHSHALLWDDGVMTDLGMHGGTDAYTQGINDLGQVTGGYNTADGKSHGFLYDHGVMYDINELLPPSSRGDRRGHHHELRLHPRLQRRGSVLLIPGPDRRRVTT